MSLAAFALRLGATIGRKVSRSSNAARYGYHGCCQSSIGKSKPSSSSQAQVPRSNNLLRELYNHYSSSRRSKQYSIVQALSAALQDNGSTGRGFTGQTHTLSLGFHSTSYLAKAKKKRPRAPTIQEGPLLADELKPVVLPPVVWHAPELTPKEKKKMKHYIPQEKTHPFIVGGKGITENLGLHIRQHFNKHAFAKVALKQRPMGLKVKDCITELERMTGGTCCVKEPTKIILYRGWLRGEDPPWTKSGPETGELPPAAESLTTPVLGKEAETASVDSDASVQKADGSTDGSPTKMATGTDASGQHSDGLSNGKLRETAANSEASEHDSGAPVGKLGEFADSDATGHHLDGSADDRVVECRKDEGTEGFEKHDGSSRLEESDRGRVDEDEGKNKAGWGWFGGWKS